MSFNAAQPFTAKEATSYVQNSIAYYKKVPVFGYAKAQDIYEKVRRALGYVPIIGTFIGLRNLWSVKEEGKFINELLTRAKDAPETTKSELKRESTKYKIKSIARSVIETLSIGAVLAPVDAVVTWIRGREEKGKS
jgi:hypothetical protein